LTIMNKYAMFKIRQLGNIHFIHVVNRGLPSK